MASFISKSSAFSVLWVQELYKTAEANGVNVISYTHAALPHFFYTTLTVTAWVGMQKHYSSQICIMPTADHKSSPLPHAQTKSNFCQLLTCTSSQLFSTKACFCVLEVAGFGA